MHRSIVICITAVLLTGALAPCADAQTARGQTSAPAAAGARLTDKDIVGLVKADLSPAIIIAKIKTSACSFDTTPAALKALKSARVPDSVILAMIEASGETGPAPGTGPTQSNAAQATPNGKAGAEVTATKAPSAQPAQAGRRLWVAKFTGQPEASAAIASAQQGDLAALQQSNLFKGVSSFASQSEQPAGTWSLSAKETSYYAGSTAKRVLFGFGTGRAHIIMAYKLRNPQGKVVWAGKIKTEPSFWASSGTLGGVQNQATAERKQPRSLMDALSKFFGSQNSP